jgi:H+/Cl- antiporter ClcA
MNMSSRHIILEFNVKQYSELRSSLLAAVLEERQMERYVLLACGAFYSWFSTQRLATPLLHGFAAIIPVVIVFFALLRDSVISSGIRTQASYLVLLEKSIYSHPPKGYRGPYGWESFLKNEDSYVERYLSNHSFFWWGLLMSSLLASCALWWFS